MSNVKIKTSLTGTDKTLAKEMYDAVYGDGVKQSETVGVVGTSNGTGVYFQGGINSAVNTLQNCYTDYRYLLEYPYRYNYYVNQRAFVQYELDAEYLIEISIPGFKADNFDLKLDINKLEVRAERPPYNVPAGYRTRAGGGMDYSGLTQTFTFDKKIDLDSAEANYEAGILTIKVKKVPDERSRTIKVK